MVRKQGLKKKVEFFINRTFSQEKRKGNKESGINGKGNIAAAAAILGNILEGKNPELLDYNAEAAALKTSPSEEDKRTRSGTQEEERINAGRNRRWNILPPFSSLRRDVETQGQPSEAEHSIEVVSSSKRSELVL